MYSEYLIRFLEEYRGVGIDIELLTVQKRAPTPTPGGYPGTDMPVWQQAKLIDWHANLLANPDFTFHLKNGSAQIWLKGPRLSPTPLNVRLCWPRPSAISIRPHDPGTIRPTRLEDWADSRLMRISFRHWS